MQSTSIAALAASLAKAQVAFKPALKDAANPFFKSKYVDLAGAIDACRNALSLNGLAVVQTLEDGDRLRLISTLMHSSGEWISSQYPVVPVKNDPQGIGSALTYARRYSLMALVGLAAEDDDGNAASGNAPSVSAKVASKTGAILKAKPKWLEDQTNEVGEIFAEIYRLGGVQGEADVAKLRKEMAYDMPSDVIDAAALVQRKWQDLAAQESTQS